MKTVFFCILFLLGISSCLESQNPILLEETFTNGLEGFYWVNSLERTYDNKDKLICKKTIRRETGHLARLNATCYTDGYQSQTLTGFRSKGPEGIYKWEAIIYYEKNGRIKASEVQETEFGEDVPLIKDRKAYLPVGEDIVLSKFLKDNGSVDTTTGYVFILYDEHNRLVGQILNWNHQVDLQLLRKRFRVTYNNLENGSTKRIVETKDCHAFDRCKNENCIALLEDCTDWYILSQQIYDEQNRLVVDGPNKRFNRSGDIMLYEYLPTKTVVTRNYFRFNPDTPQDTFIVHSTTSITDKDGKLLEESVKTQTQNKKSIHYYNENDLIRQTDIIEVIGEDTSKQTIVYEYTFFCDGLPKEQFSRNITSVEPFEKVVYHYKYPVACNLSLPEKLNIQLFPNPATGFLTISSDLFFEYKADIRILDNIGRIIQQAENNRSRRFIMNISNLTSGVYFVHIYIGREFFVKRLVVY